MLERQNQCEVTIFFIIKHNGLAFSLSSNNNVQNFFISFSRAVPTTARVKLDHYHQKLKVGVASGYAKLFNIMNLWKKFQKNFFSGCNQTSFFRSDTQNWHFDNSSKGFICMKLSTESCNLINFLKVSQMCCLLLSEETNFSF